MSMNKICCLWTYYVFCLAGILLISCTEDEVAGTPFITISKQELAFGKAIRPDCTDAVNHRIVRIIE